ncbi:MAG: site-specific integrase [Hyphomicrobiaceae bacterium]
MAAVKLTKRIIELATSSDRDQFLWDSEVKGFGVRIWPSGRKTFVAKYRAGGGRFSPSRRLTIGTYGVLTVEQARASAKKALAAVVQGFDPASEKQAKRREITVAQLIDLYAERGTAHLKERNRRWTLARLRHHVVPLLGHQKISEVRIADIEQFMRDVKAGITAKDEKNGPRARVIVKGGAGAAAKGIRDLSAVFAFAVRQELLASNPCTPVKKPADRKRLRYLTLDEVKRLGATLDELLLEGTNPKAIAIIRLWALTGCRRDEIAGLSWEEVDFANACLRLKDSKTGHSVRPLASAAFTLLQGRDRVPGCDYVFPSDDGATFYQGTKRFWPIVVARAQLPGVTPHTLRHTLGSAAVSSGETLTMTGALLGHANARSTAIYAHMQQDPARKAADRVVGPIAAALNATRTSKTIG